MKRGTEKPIEIFVALFVILAVALVMLQLFEAQLANSQKDLADREQAQKAQQDRQELQLHCENLCTRASNNGCSRQALAALCLAGSHQIMDPGDFYDFNGNNVEDFDIENFGGTGVCEDQVHCFNTIDTCCAQQITPESCSRILDGYWDSQGWEVESQQRASLCGTIETGSCEPGDLESLAWWNQFDVCNLS